MPGAFLDVLGYYRQPPVHLSALAQRHVTVESRLQKRMGKPQHLTITFDHASIDSLVDRRPRLRLVTGRADQPLTRIGGRSDQPTHLPHRRRQPAYATVHETTDTSRNR